MKRKRGIQVVGGALFTLLVLAQLVPYGRNHTNPPSAAVSPPWDSRRTEELVRRACFDCHSNETQWPWYASVAPISWLVQKDVDEARSELNFSRFDVIQEEAGEAAEVVRKGDMPPWDYLLLHPEARLDPEERRALIQGLARTFGDEEHEEQSSEMDEHDED